MNNGLRHCFLHDGASQSGLLVICTMIVQQNVLETDAPPQWDTIVQTTIKTDASFSVRHKAPFPCQIFRMRRVYRTNPQRMRLCKNKQQTKERTSIDYINKRQSHRHRKKAQNQR